MRVLIVMSLLFVGACVEPVYDAMGWSQDIAEREAWKTQALRGDVGAQYEVGRLYCCGERPRYDVVEALYWWCQAARKGQRDALFGIGQIYETAHKIEGEIVPKDHALAWVYYSLARDHNQPKALAAQTKLAASMSKDELTRAEDLHSQWPAIQCEVSR